MARTTPTRRHSPVRSPGFRCTYVAWVSRGPPTAQWSRPWESTAEAGSRGSTPPPRPPRKAVSSVRPEQLRDRERGSLVEIDPGAEEVLVPAGVHRADGDRVAVQDVVSYLFRFEGATVPDLGPGRVEDGHHRFDPEPEDADLRTAQGVPQADGVGPVRLAARLRRRRPSHASRSQSRSPIHGCRVPPRRDPRRVVRRGGRNRGSHPSEEGRATPDQERRRAACGPCEGARGRTMTTDSDRWATRTNVEVAGQRGATTRVSPEG